MSEEREKKKGFFARLKEGMTKTRDNLAEKVDNLLHRSRELYDEFFEELEEILIGADLGVKTTADLTETLRKRIKEKKLKDAASVKQELRGILVELMQQEDLRLEAPSILLIVGVNGVGKTTSIGKLAHYYQAQGTDVVICAADTFRAAAVEQLATWAERAKVPLVKHGEGADPAAVVFDAIQSARARRAGMLIVDTAGRLHNKKHLMEELKKIGRVCAREWPEAQLHAWLVIDATTGQNGVNQARQFMEAVELDGMILTKLDGTAKGGIVVPVRNELGLPVRFVCVGEQLGDIQPFDARNYAEAMLPLEV